MSVAPETCKAIAIRVDGGSRIGSGHVVRCLTLAAELVRSGARVTFICRDLPGGMARLIEREGHALVSLRAPSPSPAQSADSGSCWLQVASTQDADETAQVLAVLRPQWLITDHYGIGAEWERAQRRWVGRVLAIDDLADRTHDCDVLVDQNYHGARTRNRYHGLVPAHCRLLLGPRYAILQPEYASLRKILVPRVGDPRRVLVFFGGSDATDETSKTLRALASPALAHLAIDVVLGTNHPDPEGVAALATSRPGTMVYTGLPTLAGLMFRADIAVGAGGVATLERLCMGLPSVVVTIASNQEEPTSSLCQEGAVTWVGPAGSVSVADVEGAIVRALHSRPDLPRIVDGRGVARISAAMQPPSPQRLSLHRAKMGDAEVLFEWRNEALSREMSFDPGCIPWSSHLDWLDRKLADSDAEIFIGEVDALPVGQARLDYRNDEAMISYSVDADVRGLGFGAALIEGAVRCARHTPARGFHARVKAQNMASRKIFQRLGWRETIDGTIHDFRHP